MNTLSNLYGIQINGKALTTDSPEYHYLRLNFTGFSELIDELGGITVNVEEGFSTYTYANYTDKDMQTNKSKRKKYTFTKGKMKMDGATALTYGYQNFNQEIMYSICVILIILVAIIQYFGDWIYKKLK